MIGSKSKYQITVNRFNRIQIQFIVFGNCRHATHLAGFAIHQLFET